MFIFTANVTTSKTTTTLKTNQLSFFINPIKSKNPLFKILKLILFDFFIFKAYFTTNKIANKAKNIINYKHLRKFAIKYNKIKKLKFQGILDY